VTISYPYSVTWIFIVMISLMCVTNMMYILIYLFLVLSNHSDMFLYILYVLKV
jgi:hypothetical protein